MIFDDFNQAFIQEPNNMLLDSDMLIFVFTLILI